MPLVMSSRAALPLSWSAPIASANRKNTPAIASRARSQTISDCACSLATNDRPMAAPTSSPARTSSSPTRPGCSERSMEPVACGAAAGEPGPSVPGTGSPDFCGPAAGAGGPVTSAIGFIPERVPR